VNLWKSIDAKPSVTTEAFDNSAGTVDGVNAVKVAAMKDAELVNRNIAAFGAGTRRLSTDEKKKLPWDVSPIVPAFKSCFDNALNATVSELNFKTIVDGLGVVLYQYPFNVPAYYALILRSLTVLEDLALYADPDFKVLAASYPYFAKRLLTDPNPYLRDALLELVFKDGKFRQVQNLTATNIMKCDDDTFVRVDVVLRHIKLNNGDKPLYMGNLNLLHRPLRTGKCAVTNEEWPEDIYPPYANGPGYVIYGDIAKFIVSQHANQSLRMEDVSMGLWVEKFNATKP
ncbi:hypothetical protein ACJX0J_034042, partial [Zea mays]